MKKKDAKAYIDRQHREGRATKAGILHVFYLRKGYSAERMRQAIEAMGGDVFDDYSANYFAHPIQQTRWRRAQGFNVIRAFVPDPENPNLDYIPPCCQP